MDVYTEKASELEQMAADLSTRGYIVRPRPVRTEPVPALSPSATSDFVIMTYNLWNLNSGPHWDRRLYQIVDVIRKEKPDMIGFQEIRQEFTGKLRNQLTQIASLLPEYQFHFQPAQVETDQEEGLGWLSRHPVSDITYVELPVLSTAQDHLVRICLKGTVHTGPSKLGDVNVFVTHLAFVPEPQLMQSVAVYNFMLSFAGDGLPQFVVGDWNAFPGHPEFHDFLVGKLQVETSTVIAAGRAITTTTIVSSGKTVQGSSPSHGQVQMSGVRFVGDLVEAFQPNDTWPTWKPIHRPDRIYYRSSSSSIVDAQRQESLGPEFKVYAASVHLTGFPEHMDDRDIVASDHLAVTARLTGCGIGFIYQQSNLGYGGGACRRACDEGYFYDVDAVELSTSHRSSKNVSLCSPICSVPCEHNMMCTAPNFCTCHARHIEIMKGHCHHIISVAAVSLVLPLIALYAGFATYKRCKASARLLQEYDHDVIAMEDVYTRHDDFSNPR